jgi:hypothetical protein
MAVRVGTVIFGVPGTQIGCCADHRLLNSSNSPGKLEDSQAGREAATMDRTAADAINKQMGVSPADAELLYPWPEHDIAKGEIAEEFDALKRAVTRR